MPKKKKSWYIVFFIFYYLDEKIIIDVAVVVHSNGEGGGVSLGDKTCVRCMLSRVSVVCSVVGDICSATFYVQPSPIIIIILYYVLSMFKHPKCLLYTARLSKIIYNIVKWKRRVNGYYPVYIYNIYI